MTRAEFLAQAKTAALAAAKASGLPAGITVAQAALESAWGNSGLSQQAHNYFGIKARGKEASISMETRECNAQGEIRCVAKFARFYNMQECFEARDRMILKLPCYATALAAKEDPESFVRELAKHWATDPHYAERILAVYKDCGLDALDGKAAAASCG